MKVIEWVLKSVTGRMAGFPTGGRDSQKSGFEITPDEYITKRSKIS